MTDIKMIRTDRLHTIIKGTPSDNNSLSAEISPSREGMAVKHKSQTPVLECSEINRILSGQEKEYGKYVFTSEIEPVLDDEQVANDDIVNIIGIFKRYERMLTKSGAVIPPELIVIYVNTTGIIDYMRINRHELRHPTIGYENKYINQDKLKVGEFVPVNTIFARSNNVKEGGIYATGVNLRTALGSFQSVPEDGILISTTACEKLSFHFVEKYKFAFGRSRFPLNMYGDDNMYKIIPDIGSVVGENNILAALRRYDTVANITRMSKKALSRADRVTDQIISLPAGSEVVDIQIHHNDNMGLRNADTPLLMTEQVNMYYLKEREFYERIDSCIENYQRNNGYKVRLTPKLERLRCKGFEYKKSIIGQRLEKGYRNVPIDEWVVEVTVKRKLVPGMGYKLTGYHSANKGVICQVETPENMPKTKDGRPIDIAYEALSAVKRTIPSVPFELSLNAHREYEEIRLAEIIKTTGDYELAFAHFQQWASEVGVEFGQSVKLTGDTPLERQHFIEHTLKYGIYLEIPNDRDRSLLDAITLLVKNYPDVREPLLLKAPNGEWVETIHKFTVGSSYCIPLEKTPSSWAGLSTLKRNPFGVPAKLSNADKLQTIGREQPVRVIGEAEYRLACATIGSKNMKHIIASSNNIQAHNEMIDTILSNPKPFGVESCFNDKDNSETNIVTLTKLIYTVMGVEIVND